jgi:hypothetical protein
VKTKEDKTANWVVITEIAFCILPLLVVLIYDYAKASLLDLFSMLLYGQCIVKLVVGLLKKKTPSNWQFVSLIITLLISFGLTPAVVVVILMQDASIILGIKILQVVLFIISIYIYFQVAGLAEKYNQQEE